MAEPIKLEIQGQREQEEKDYELTRGPKPKEETPTNETPEYHQAIDLTEKQDDRLMEIAVREFEAIKQEREELGLEEKWRMYQNQYDGVMEENQDQQFNVHMHTTKIKIDAIVRGAKASFLESDPKFAITPQPGYAYRNSREADEVCTAQQDFLDFQISQDLSLENPLEKALYSNAIKGAPGMLKIPWKYRSEPREREECYEGRFVVQGVVQGRAIVRNPGLEELVQKYPDIQKRHPDIYEAVKRGKTQYVQAKYSEVTYNNPDPQFVPIENFYVYNRTDGLKGLKECRCICETKEYSWNDLREMERSEGWSNIDSMRYPGSVRSAEYKKMTEAERNEP